MSAGESEFPSHETHEAEPQLLAVSSEQLLADRTQLLWAANVLQNVAGDTYHTVVTDLHRIAGNKDEELGLRGHSHLLDTKEVTPIGAGRVILNRMLFRQPR